MKLRTNLALQIIAVTVQTMLQVAEVVKPTVRPWIMVGITGLQGAAAIIAHYNNPDGTPAVVRWTSEKNRKRNAS